MKMFLKPILLFSILQTKRIMRDPVAILILWGIPLILLVGFGALANNQNNINLRLVLIDNSGSQTAGQIKQGIESVDIFEVDNEVKEIGQARELMFNSELDAIIEFPQGFASNNNSAPGGNVNVYLDEQDTITSQIVMGILNNIIDGYNLQVTGVDMPVKISQQPVSVNEVEPIDNFYAMFVPMGMLMIGAMGLGIAMATDKKQNILRRLHVTPLKSSQIGSAYAIAYAFSAIILVTVMTAISILLFGMDNSGSWWALALFLALGIIMFIGIGLVIASVAKNTGQAEGISQVVFLVSLALGGIWFPVALMPAFLQSFVTYLPLTPLVDGIKFIMIEGRSLLDLGPQILVVLAWIVIAYSISFKTFKWE